MKQKYRGKKDREWVYGNVHECWSRYIICDHIRYDVGEEKHFLTDVHCNSFLVNENTIGENTGKKDKNLVEIYEGDIITFTINTNKLEKCRGVVKWFSGFFRIWKDDKRPAYSIMGLSLDSIHEQNSEIEVIGNIYDNPELLEKLRNDSNKC